MFQTFHHNKLSILSRHFKIFRIFKISRQHNTEYGQGEQISQNNEILMPIFKRFILETSVSELTYIDLVDFLWVILDYMIFNNVSPVTVIRTIRTLLPDAQMLPPDVT